MAGIAGQPTPKPGDLPKADPYAELDAYAAEQTAKPDPYADLDAYAAQQSAENPPTVPGEFAGAGAVQTAAEWLPTAGGIAGGIVGSVLGPGGAIAGATLGGMAGQGYRELIETQILKKTPSETPLQDAGMAGLTEGAGQAIGMGVGKLAGAAITKGAALAKAPLTYAGEVIQAAKDKLTEPILKLIAERSTPLTSEASGDAVKTLLKDNIKQRYGPFIQAYADLDQVSKALPIKDEMRRGFTNSLKEWGTDTLAGDNYKMIKKFADDIDAANTGAHLDNIIKQIGDARQVALNTGATSQASVLKELQSRASGFLEGETTKLAARIQAGKASEVEMDFLNRIAQQRGIVEPDPTKYAKSLAKDYLSSKDKIRTDYAGFRNFLSEVGEQTKVRTSKVGPMQFLENLDDVPSEKLVEKMFDPKNAAALRRMQRETPEVFSEVTKAKVTSLMQKASPNGKLDLPALRTEINKIPASTRTMLFGSDEVQMINRSLDNPELMRLDSLNKTMQNYVVKWADNVEQAVKTAGPKVMPGPKKATVIKQAIGKPIASLVDAFVNGQPAEYEEPPQ